MANRDLIVIIVQPTIELIEKTIKDELRTRSNPPPYHAFHGKSVPNRSVAKVLAEYLRSPQDGGHIIFTTHQVLQYVPYWTNKKELHLLIDEDLQVVRYVRHQLPHNHGLITDHLKIVPHNSIYGRVTIADRQAVDAKARNKDDDAVFDVIAETLRIIRNSHWESFVNLEQYERLRAGGGATLAIHSVLKPAILAGFGSVFMTAAEFEQTLIYKLWTEAGVQFVQDVGFSSKLRYTSHPNGELITFYYVTGSPWSKKLRKTALDEGTVQDLMLAGAAKLFTGNQFVWQANAEYTDDPFATQGIRLPNKPHGLNAYSHLHDIAFVSSLNPNPDHIKFLQNRGLSAEDIRGCIYFATCYQSIMRTSIRDPGDINPKRVLVPDLGAAEYLKGMFPGSRIEWLDVGIPQRSTIKKGGRPRKHANNAARVAHQRKKVRERLVADLRKLAGHRVLQDHLFQGEGNCEENGGAETGIRIITSIGTAVSDGSLFSSKNQSRAFSFVWTATTEDFVSLLYNIWSD